MVRLFFGSTLDHGWLTLASIVAGVVVGLGAASIQRIPNYTMNIFGGIFISTIAIMVVNEKWSAEEIYYEEFTVTDIGSTTIKHDKFDYIELTNSNHTARHSLEDNSYYLYKSGDTVTVELKNGYFGFPIVQNVEK